MQGPDEANPSLPHPSDHGQTRDRARWGRHQQDVANPWQLAFTDQAPGCTLEEKGRAAVPHGQMDETPP